MCVATSHTVILRLMVCAHFERLPAVSGVAVVVHLFEPNPAGRLGSCCILGSCAEWLSR